MWPNPLFPADLVTFTEEILNGKLHFCAVMVQKDNKGRLKEMDLVLTNDNDTMKS